MDKTIRYSSLDAFRGLASIFVAFFHMPPSSILTNNVFIKHSGVFVDFFFILSGFVIYHNYKNRIFDFASSKLFLLKRFKRLIPLHLYTLLVIFLLEIAKLITYNFLPYSSPPFEINTINTLWTQLFLLNSTPLFMGFNWNGSNWSISAELIAYITFAIISIICFRSFYLKIALFVLSIFL